MIKAISTTANSTKSAVSSSSPTEGPLLQELLPLLPFVGRLFIWPVKATH
jgi:hypothetical protein